MSGDGGARKIIRHGKEEALSRPRRYGLPGALAAAALALGLGGPKAFADDLTVGFVTHAQGNPFIQQIVDGAQAAATISA